MFAMAAIAVTRNILRGPRTASRAAPALVATRQGLPFRLLVALLCTADDLVWIATFGWMKFLLHNKNKVRSHAVDGAEEGVRQLDPSSPLVDNCEGAETVYEILQASLLQFANRPAFGTRTFLGTTEAAGPKNHTKKIFGETTWRTYAEVGSRAEAFGAALRHAGSVPFVGTASDFEVAPPGNHCMMIYENTCDDWTTAFLGAMSQSIVVATSYATLGFDAMLESAEETGASLLLCNRSVVEAVAQRAAGSKVLTTIVYSNNYVDPATAAQPLPGELNGIKIFSMDEFISSGRLAPMEAAPPTADTLAVIMYTSGSTGKPKGVMLTHRCLAAAAGGTLIKLCGQGSFKYGTETYLAYLPAAHILELIAEVVFIAMGSAIGYADPRTISSKGAARRTPSGELNESPQGGQYPAGAIQEFRPTFMAGVPKVWDTLRSGGQAALAKRGPLFTAVIEEMVACRDAALRMGTDTPLFGRIFHKTMGKMIGGRLKTIISGGGPLSSTTQSWVRSTMCPCFIQGYGLTETSGATAAQDLDEVRDGIAGCPLKSVELRLVSVPGVRDTMGKEYRVTDTEHAVKKVDTEKRMACAGRGELWIRGPTVAPGYFRLPEKTKSEYTEDGWFKTGDICVWTVDGSLKIVDRLKNLVKLRGGEYIAVENMEKEYAQSVYVNQLSGGVLVVADGKMDRPCLLAQANMAQIGRLATKLGLEGSALGLCRHPDIEKAVRADMVSVAMASLSPLEKIAAVRLLPGTDPNDAPLSETAPWTVENGGILASNKLGRKAIERELAPIVQQLRTNGIFD